MHTDVEDHVIYQLANAPLRAYPYPHLYVESVFPTGFYGALRAHWPQSSQLVSLESTGRVTKGAYRERFVMPLREKEIGSLPPETAAFWRAVAKWMLGSERLRSAVIEKFEPYVRSRFGDALEELDLSHEVLVVRDHTNYNLGPHTDSPRRVVSLLFYCPDDASHSHLGTSLYRPIDPAFRCQGGPHHPHDRFHRVATMEYKPNALFAFVKTDNSFHGVEPIRDADVLRDLILYDIQVNGVRRPPGTGPADTPRETAARLQPTPDAAPEATSGGDRGSLGLRILKNMLRRGR